jgi:hypothetical protein
MEDSDKVLESTGSADENNRAPAGNATGRIDLQYTKPGGTPQRWSLIQFMNFRSQYDARNRIWMAEGNAVSDTRPLQGFHIKLAYDVSKRVLTISLGGYVFNVPGTHMRAGLFNNETTLEIGFLGDAEGHTDIAGEQYLIKRNSRLTLSL